MWGFMRHGIVPDMVSLGKPMGNGYPVAGLVARPEVVAAFGAKARYFNTFGGNAVAAATAMAVLDVIEDEGLLANARDTGAYLAGGLRDLAARHGCIGAVRGAGLFIGADILRDGVADAALAGQIVNRLREAQVLISATARAGNVLKIRPPLVFGREHADIFLDRMGRVLAAL
jgi:4-aminobutyrate aminotransferase-like enzyme